MKTFVRIILIAFLAMHLGAADARYPEAQPTAVAVKPTICRFEGGPTPISVGAFIAFTALAIYVIIVLRKNRPPHVSAYQPSSLVILSSGIYRHFEESVKSPVMSDSVTVFVARSFEGLSDDAVLTLLSEGVKPGKAYLKRAMPHLRQDTYRYIRDINPQLTDKNICMLFGLPA